MTAGRLVRSVRHTPARQLLHRARLLVKRRALAAAARGFPALAAPRRVEPPALAANPPKVLLPAPQGHVRTSGHEYVFDLLNLERRFSLPLDWHGPELNRGTRLWKLHLHYFDYCGELSDAAFQALAEDWIEQNRPYRPGYWLDSWNSYAVSIRLVAWMGEYARRRKRIDAAFLHSLRVSIHEQLQFLEANLELDIGGNHLVKNVKALYWGSRFFAGAAAERYGALAGRLLASELRTQVLADGFHFELSPAYHCQVFGDLLDCWRLMPEGELRSLLALKLAQMAQVVADMTHPDGGISLFNDGGLTMAVPVEMLLDAYETLLGERPRPRGDARFPEAGYYVMRTEDFYLVCDAGRVGPDGLPAHAHGDIFAFELTVGGQRMIVDCGVFEYDAGAKRSWSRSTAAHNTLTLDDRDQCEFWSAFRLGRRADVRVHAGGMADGELVIDAEHDGYAHLDGAPVHRRRTRMEPNGRLTIRDTVRGGSGQRAASRLLLHPSVEIVRHDKGRMLLQAGAARIAVDTEGKARIETRTAPWWPDFGREVETKQIVLDYGPAPGAWEYRISLVDS